MTERKIFCIGFQKTGTKSLKAALQILGYRVTGPNGIDNPRIAEEALSLALSLVPKFDAFQDNPWPILFRELQSRFGEARFILTVRPGDAWLQSVVRHFGRLRTPMREWIYGKGHGCPAGHEEHYLARYEEHNHRVLMHFQKSSSAFLVLRITEGQGWETLCPFLQKPIPQVPFPHANAGKRIGSDRSATNDVNHRSEAEC